MDTQTGTENIGPLLARANLLRIRGQWVDAAEACAEVLRLSPHNPTAHSLLGDIYQDQGRPEEARHWYHLALEVNPGSEADRAKLARTEEMLEARQQRAEWQAIIEGTRRPVAGGLLVREMIQRVGAIAGAVLCGVILVAATLVTVSEQGTTANEDVGRPSTLLRARVPRPLLPETGAERDLLSRISSSSRMALAQPVRLTLDPRSNTARLRVVLPARARERLTTPSFRARVLREAYRMAYVVHQAAPTLALIDLYVLGPVIQPSGATENALLFVGSVVPKSVWQDPDAVPQDRIEAVFGEIAPPWWSSDLRTP